MALHCMLIILKTSFFFVLRKDSESVKTMPENSLMFFQDSSIQHNPWKISEQGLIDYQQIR